ncbi:MAG: hypothetical protein EOO74_05015 [Myxococcales bacterium]|nr:MAG: hypothetical protein EOO74_05015 [Myxococcales bacterium]
MNAGRGIGSGGGIALRSIGRQTTPPAAPSARLFQYTWPTGSVTLLLAASPHEAIGILIASDLTRGPLEVSRLSQPDQLVLTLDPNIDKHEEMVAAALAEEGEVIVSRFHYGWQVGDMSEGTLRTFPSHADVLAAGEREHAEMTKALNEFKAGGR